MTGLSRVYRKEREGQRRQKEGALGHLLVLPPSSEHTHRPRLYVLRFMVSETGGQELKPFS